MPGFKRACPDVRVVGGDAPGGGQVVTAMSTMAALAKDTSESDKEALTQGRSFQTLVDMVLLGARRYGPGDLLRVLDACSAVGFDDDHLLDKARRHRRAAA